MTAPTPMPRVWEMWALNSGNGAWFAVGDERYTRFHDCGEPIPVTVTEDAEGDHLGWLDDDEAEPVMIQHHRIFDVQFPYGHRAEEKAGRGRAIPLRIEERAP